MQLLAEVYTYWLTNSVCMGDVYGVIHDVHYFVDFICIAFSVYFSPALLIMLFLALNLLSIKFTLVLNL